MNGKTFRENYEGSGQWRIVADFMNRVGRFLNNLRAGGAAMVERNESGSVTFTVEEASTRGGGLVKVSFWARLALVDGARKLLVRRGFASLAGGPVVGVAPPSGDEFVFALPASGSTLGVWLKWTKAEDPAADEWSVESGTIGSMPTVGTDHGIDWTWAPLCYVAWEGSPLAPRIVWSAPGDKLGLQFAPGGRGVAGDVWVFDGAHKRFQLAADMPPGEGWDDYERLQRVNGSMAGQAGFRWVADPVGIRAGQMQIWDDGAKAWVLLTGSKDDILFWSDADGWRVLNAPAAASVLTHSGYGGSLSWQPAENYLNP